MTSSRDQEVMGLWDEGVSRQKIAARLQMSISTVNAILSRFASHNGQDESAAKIGSANRLAAITQHHPEELLRQPGRRL